MIKHTFPCIINIYNVNLINLLFFRIQTSLFFNETSFYDVILFDHSKKFATQSRMPSHIPNKTPFRITVKTVSLLAFQLSLLARIIVVRKHICFPLPFPCLYPLYCPQSHYYICSSRFPLQVSRNSTC